MTTATQHVHERIAVVFDFDLTLGPGTLDTLLRRCGEDPDAWRRERVAPLRGGGWEEVLAEVYGLVALSRSGKAKITKDLVKEAGRSLKPFDGAAGMFEALRSRAREVLPELDVEFYVLSSGLLDVISATSIAPELDGLWGTRLHFEEATGELDFPMLVVTYPEKVRYLLALCKGLDPTGANAPAHVYEDVPPEKWHVPVDQVVYVGDGSSDMATFRFLNRRGGLAIAVFKSETAQDWRGMAEMHSDRRVQTLARADYQEDSELMRSLVLAVESIAKKIALRRLSKGE